MIILDTNVLSELVKPAPAASVVEWMVARRSAQSLFITTVTQAEMLYGVALLPEGQRRTALAEAVNAMFEQDFDARILPFDQSAARACAELAVRRRRAGKPISQFDDQIAAIALSRGAAIATRNVDDFADLALEVFDPWA